MVDSEVKHITGYPVYGKVLIVLLVLTILTIVIPSLNLTAATVLIALLLASTKAGIVMTYFMHLKMENLLLRILVIMVLGIYASVILLTFADYVFR
ncbi:MAG: cytochrome C oxidase subunit IV family protein [Bacteroidetes bacterium]|nr:cytochrome C oxidase subunit IV family protein [Bacteroidota bacterium]